MCWISLPTFLRYFFNKKGQAWGYGDLLTNDHQNLTREHSIICCTVSKQGVHQSVLADNSCLLMETWLTQTNIYKGDIKTISWRTIKCSAERGYFYATMSNHSHYTSVISSSVVIKYKLVQHKSWQYHKNLNQRSPSAAWLYLYV